MDELVLKLEQILEKRKLAKADESYVAFLYQQGIDVILKKIGEESAELIIAAKGDDPTKIVHETADLYFHILVLLRYKNIDMDAVEQELSKRFGLSGLKEKSSRKNN